MSDVVTNSDILEDILGRLEKGVSPWRKPWTDAPKVAVIGSLPISAADWPSNLRAPRIPYGVYNGTITMWHEVIHWTSHHSRLNRDRHKSWGDQIYAFEELVAELGSAFLCARLGVAGDMQHPSYLDSWCKALKRDRTQALWDASELATKATDYVLDKPRPRVGRMNAW